MKSMLLKKTRNISFLNIKWKILRLNLRTVYKPDTGICNCHVIRIRTGGSLCLFFITPDKKPETN